MTNFPPPPRFQPPPSESTPPITPNSYLSARQNELEAIRRKGVAKVFSRHFTTLSEKIVAEREAADKALAEIVARKTALAANPISFDKGGLTLTQLDAMHMEYQKRKQSVQQKERETMELYRRYVSQYGGNDAMTQKTLLKRPNNIPTPAIMGSPGLSMGSTMPILHENRDYDIVRQTDLMLAREKEKENCDGVGSPTVRKLEDGSFYDKGVVYPSSAPIAVGKLMRKEATTTTTSTTLKVLPSTGEKLSSDMETPGDVSSSGSSLPAPQDRSSTNKETSEIAPLSPSNSLGNASGIDSSFLGGVMVDVGATNPKDDYFGDDADSTMSGLTSVDGATFAEAEFKLTEFLREETENIRKILSAGVGVLGEDELSMATTKSSTSVESRRAVEAAKKAEEMAQKMQEETAWMRDPSLLEGDSDGEKSTAAEDVTETVPAKVEWTAYWSEEHERVYYFNLNTNQTCWTEPRDVLIDKSALEKSKIFQVKSCEDEDAVVVKDYTKRGSKDEQTETSAMEENFKMINQFRPTTDMRSVGSGSVSKSSKVLAFKRKRALRMRKKRLRLIAAFTLLSAFSIGIYNTRERWMPMLGLQTARQKEKRALQEVAAAAAKEKELEAMKRIEEEWKAAAKKIEAERKKAELEAKRMAEEEHKKAELEAARKAEKERNKAELVAKRKVEEERKKVELATKKNAEEERKKVEVAAKRKAEEERKKAELEAKRNAEEKRKKAELAVKRRAEEERKKAELEVKRKSEEERKKTELAAKRNAEEERKKTELAAKRNAEEERKKAEEKRVADATIAEEERQLLEWAAKKKEEEKAKKKEEERRRKWAARKAAEKERIRRDLEEQIRQKELKKQEYEIAEMEQVKESRQKILCYFPFSIYFMRACKIFAKEKPIFNPETLIQLMLE